MKERVGKLKYCIISAFMINTSTFPEFANKDEISVCFLKSDFLSWVGNNQTRFQSKFHMYLLNSTVTSFSCLPKHENQMHISLIHGQYMFRDSFL